jgi:chemotaxis protein methyltransferase CheR
MEDLKKLIRSYSGLKIEGSILTQFEEKLRLWLQRYGNDKQKLLDHLKMNPDLLNNFVSEITINESFFFRHKEQFRLLDEIYPKLVHKRQIKILSIGCSNGCEPYSIAIHTKEYFPEIFNNINIAGIDINKEILKEARKGFYMPWYLRHTEDTIINKYFTQENKYFRINAEIKEPVSLKCVNFLHLEETDTFDIIFCRNFLIYFDEKEINKIFEKIKKLSSDDTYIIFGNADTLLVPRNFFKRINLGNGIVHLTNSSPDNAVQKKFQMNIDFISDLNIRINYDIKQQPVRVRKDESELFKNGILHLKNEDYMKAAESFSDIITNINPVNYRAKSFLAYCFLHMEQTENTKQLIKEILNSDSFVYEAYIVSGIANIFDGNHKQALSDFRKAIYIKPDSEIAWYYTGFVQEMEKHTEDAVKSYKKAKKLLKNKNPDDIYPLTSGITKQMLSDFITEKLKILS